MNKPHLRFDFADGLRGLAMLCVVLFHYTQTFWQRRDRIGEVLNMAPLGGYDDASFVLPFNLGAVGVGLFLLLSGLLIPLSLTRLGLLRFAVSRVLRIYPTYWAGLAVTVTALWLAGRIGGLGFGVTAQDVAGHASIAFQDWLGGRNIDPVMWTLKVELWFYAMLGAAFALCGQRLKPAIVLLLPLLALICRAPAWDIPGWAALQYYLAPVVCYFPLMFAGCWVYFHACGQADRVETAVCFAALLQLAVWLTGWQSPLLYASYAIGVLLFLLGAWQPRLVAGAWLVRVAALSYAWYVCHSVAGYVLMRWLALHGAPWWLMVLLALLATWCLALLLNRVVELPTQRLGKRAADALKSMQERASARP